MGTARRPASNHICAFGELVIERELNVGEPAAQRGEELLVALGAARLAVRGRRMADVVAGDELVDDIELPLTPDFVDETTNEAFVLTEHGETSSRLVADFVCPPSARLVCQWATGIGRSP